MTQSWYVCSLQPDCGKLTPREVTSSYELLVVPPEPTNQHISQLPSRTCLFLLSFFRSRWSMPTANKPMWKDFTASTTNVQAKNLLSSSPHGLQYCRVQGAGDRALCSISLGGRESHFSNSGAKPSSADTENALKKCFLSFRSSPL